MKGRVVSEVVVPEVVELFDAGPVDRGVVVERLVVDQSTTTHYHYPQRPAAGAVRCAPVAAIVPPPGRDRPRLPMWGLTVTVVSQALHGAFLAAAGVDSRVGAVTAVALLLACMALTFAELSSWYRKAVRAGA